MGDIRFHDMNMILWRINMGKSSDNSDHFLPSSLYFPGFQTQTPRELKKSLRHKFLQIEPPSIRDSLMKMKGWFMVHGSYAKLPRH
jgi:hypothetical protein